MCDNIWEYQAELEAARARLVQAKIELRRLGVDVEQIDELFEQALNEVEAIYDYSDNLRDALCEYIEARLNII